jgi:LSD1 subclass zinc finger protein
MRLFESDFASSMTKHGFITDTWNLLRSYGLEEVLGKFMVNGAFPSTHTWKNMVKARIRGREEWLWQCRLRSDPDLLRFHELHDSLRPSIWWTFARVIPSMLSLCRIVVRLCALPPGQRQMTCALCNAVTSDSACHILTCESATSKTIRDTFWVRVTDQFSVHVYVYLDARVEEDLLTCLLGMPDALVSLIGPNNLASFMGLVANLFGRICSRTFPDICRSYGF